MKIFGIGFHKTGTTSLEMALRRLGFRVTGPNHVDDPDIARRHPDIARRLSAAFDAFQDNPWPLVFRQMDAMWPGSRFILTTRDPQAWIRSLVGHFGRDTTPMREWIYGPGRGAPEGNEAHYLAVRAAHEAAVRAHFRDRPGQLLEMDIPAGDGWEKLCPFLGLPVPEGPFPHSNSAASRQAARSLAGRMHRLARRLAGRG